jgi:hypothetical protein
VVVAAVVGLGVKVAGVVVMAAAEAAEAAQTAGCCPV